MDTPSGLWPDEVALSEHTEHARVVEVYKQYLLWAEEHDLSITPPFERRTYSVADYLDAFEAAGERPGTEASDGEFPVFEG